MRLNREQIDTLKRLAAEQFGSDVEVRLFGSRADDGMRGGDSLRSAYFRASGL